MEKLTEIRIIIKNEKSNEYNYYFNDWKNMANIKCQAKKFERTLLWFFWFHADLLLITLRPCIGLFQGFDQTCVMKRKGQLLDYREIRWIGIEFHTVIRDRHHQ